MSDSFRVLRLGVIKSKLEFSCGMLAPPLRRSTMATVTKKELITEISDKTGIKYADVALVLEAFMETAVNHLAAGDEITLRTFGTFDLRVAKGKLGRNPKMPQSEVMIPDRCVVRFRPSKELRSRAAIVPVHQVNGANGLNGVNGK